MIIQLFPLTTFHFSEAFKKINKLKSLKVAQVKDEMNDDEDDGCDSVCNIAW